MHRTTTSLLFSLLLGCDTGTGTGSSDSGFGTADTGIGDGGQEGEELVGDDTATTTTAVALSSSEGSLRFGPQTIVGCVTEASITVTNTAATAVTVAGLSAAPEEFSFQIDSAFPLSLEPNTSFDLLVRYTPLDEGPDVIALSLYILDEAEPALTWSGEGSGLVYGRSDDTFIADGASDRFVLSAGAVSGTLAVQIDGVPLSEGEWSFSAEDSHITLASAPPAGVEVKTDYILTPPTCD
jgi:hypothetical protein